MKNVLLMSSIAAFAYCPTSLFAESTASSSWNTHYRLSISKYHSSGICPAYFDVIEQSRWYEGGFENSATVWLQWMAGRFDFISSYEKSVTWGAKLIDKYKYCRGYAHITSINGDIPEGSNHLRASFKNGYIYFTLDISSYGDPVAITYQNISMDNPTYRWAVAD